MTQQASRYLMKQARSLSGKGDTEALRTRLGRSPVTAYLSTLFRPDAPCRATSHAEFQDPQIQIAAFNHRARRLVEECFEAVQKHQGDLGTAAPYAAALSVAHTQNLIVSLFWAKIWELEKSGADASCVAMLKKLANLHSLSLIQKHAAEFLEDGYLSGMQIKQAREALYSLLPQVRVDAVSLVDAWDIPDLELQSQLGRYDGNAYESYFKWVMQEPVNQGKGGKGVIPGYEAYLKPMIDGRVAAEARKVREANKARL